MIQFKKSLDVKTIRDDTDKRIEWFKKSQQIYQTALKTLFPKWEGKAINKRVATELEAALAPLGYHASYDTNYGMFHVRINIPGHENGVSLLLGYHNSGTSLTQAKFIEHNLGYNNYGQAIEKLTTGKAQIPDLTSRWNIAMETLKWKQSSTKG